MKKQDGSNGYNVRPFQFEYVITAHVERDGKIVDTAAAKDKIMEAGWNGQSIQVLIDHATAALKAKLSGGVKEG